MNSLIKNEKYFILLLLTTIRKQQIALVRRITKSQLQVLVQIVYNIIHGFRSLPENDKKKLKRFKSVIRKFITRRLSITQRTDILLKHLKQFILILKPIIKELKWQRK